MKFPVFAPDGVADGAGAAGGAGAAAAGAAAAAAGDGKGGAAAGQVAAGAAAADGKGVAGDASKGAGTAGDAAAASAAAAAAAVAAGDGKGAAAATNPWDADHWKSTYAGDDPKKKAFVERRPDLKTALDAGFQADQKISELTALAKTVLPKDATAEQIATYRKENGIPEKAEAYFDTMPKAVVESLNDTSKAILTPYMELVRDLNLPPEAAAKVVQTWQANQQRMIEQRTVADNAMKAKTEDVLRQDWGNNYTAEVNNVRAFLDGAPAEVRDAVLNARTPDQEGLFNKPEFMRWIATVARTVSPYSAPVGNDGGALDQKGVEARIAELDSWMGSPRGSENYKKYYGNENVQSEYRKLVDARDMLKKRTAA